MKAMIFAAGLGTRLKPFTLNHPKALVPVGGVPMLQRVILKLKDSGIREMVVNVHHFSDQIIDFLSANNNFDVDIHISDESDLLLDTGGGILKARKWLDGDEDFIVHNADILTDFDIDEMTQRHVSTSADATLLVEDRETSRYLLFNDECRMTGWTNVSTGDVKPHGIDASLMHPLAFGGVHILAPSIFETLASYAPADTKFSITNFYIDNCSRLIISGYKPIKDYMWHDVGKPEALAEAEADISPLR